MATEQAPQSPSAQPSLEPVSPVERRYSSKVKLGEQSAETRRPFNVKSIAWPIWLSGRILETAWVAIFPTLRQLRDYRQGLLKLSLRNGECRGRRCHSRSINSGRRHEVPGIG